MAITLSDIIDAEVIPNASFLVVRYDEEYARHTLYESCRSLAEVSEEPWYTSAEVKEMWPEDQCIVIELDCDFFD